MSCPLLSACLTESMIYKRTLTDIAAIDRDCHYNGHRGTLADKSCPFDHSTDLWYIWFWVPDQKIAISSVNVRKSMFADIPLTQKDISGHLWSWHHSPKLWIKSEGKIKISNLNQGHGCSGNLTFFNSSSWIRFSFLIPQIRFSWRMFGCHDWSD